MCANYIDGYRDVKYISSCHLCHWENKLKLAYGPEEVGNKEEMFILWGVVLRIRSIKRVSLMDNGQTPRV